MLRFGGEKREGCQRGGVYVEARSPVVESSGIVVILSVKYKHGRGTRMLATEVHKSRFYHRLTHLPLVSEGTFVSIYHTQQYVKY